MEPFRTNAVAVTWEFRCHGAEAPGRSWDWQCKSKEGLSVARSTARFRSLSEAIADARVRGFSYNGIAEHRKR
jgi:hypothetical protein